MLVLMTNMNIGFLYLHTVARESMEGWILIKFSQ